MLLNILLCIGLFLVSIFSPGLAIARYFKWDSLEKLVGIIGLSLIFNYLATFTIYVFNFPAWTYYIQALINIVIFLVYFNVLKILFQDSKLRKPLYGYLMIICWIFICNGIIECFSGGAWYGDWYEHFHRTLFFLDKLPLDTIFIDLYILPARPPLMNLIASYYLAILEKDFFIFQQIFSLLNTLVFFPVYLFAYKYSNNHKTNVLIVFIFLIFNPLFVQNSTYTWTKLLTTFFILYSVYLYLSSWKYEDKLKLTMSGIMMSGAILTHYSAIPYALFLFLHYFSYVFWCRQNKLKEVLINSLISTAILSSWFFWAIYSYGIKSTFLSNTTVTDIQPLTPLENLLKILDNIYYTLIPHFISGIGNWSFRVQDAPGYARDFMFMLYQTNFYFAFGSINLMVIAYLIFKKIKNKKIIHKESLFWTAFIIFNFTLGISVHGKLSLYGLTFVCLQPIILLGIAFISGNFYKLTNFGKIIVMGGLWLDLLLGIALNLYVQSISQNDGSALWKGLNWIVYRNWDIKISNSTVFISDLLTGYHNLLWCLLIIIPIILFIMLGKTSYNKSIT